MVQLFNQQLQLQEGFHKLPFYSYDLTPGMIFTQKMPFINSMTLQLRICCSNNFRINNEQSQPVNRYNLQSIHLASGKNRKENLKIEQFEQKKMEEEIEHFLSRPDLDSNNDLLWKYNLMELNNLKQKIRKKQEVMESNLSISLPALRNNPAFDRITKPFNKQPGDQPTHQVRKAQAPIGQQLFR